jgi:hypothetical protein
MESDSKVVAIVVIVCAALLMTLVIALTVLDQVTDQRIADLIKAGVDPGKAQCAMRTNTAYCPLILAGQK